MMRQHFGSSHVPLSPAVRAGDFIFVSGQVPTGDDGAVVPGGIEGQTKRVMENVEAALKLAGAALADVVKTTVIIADARDFGADAGGRAQFFSRRAASSRAAASSGRRSFFGSGVESAFGRAVFRRCV